MLLAVSVSCAPESDPDDASPPATLAVDPSDGRTVWWHDFIVEPGADFRALTLRNLQWTGPREGPDGRDRISMYTTGAYAASLEPLGFTAERRRRFGQRTGGTSDGDIGAVRAALGCSEPPVSPCPPLEEQAYLEPWDDVEARLYAMETEHEAISTQAIGESYTGENEIVAVQFGPREAVPDPATIYVVAAYHAREWISTGVAMYLADWLTKTLIDPMADPELHDALLEAAVVVVPVVNPDGYEKTWGTGPWPEERMWRNNLNTASCSQAVNLNRNHTVTWGEEAGGTEQTCGTGESWKGSMLQSETEAMEDLFEGTAFTSGTQEPAAVVTYHSYADMVIYPDGYSKGGSGPDCGLREDFNNCFNPDLTMLRDLFGDTHHAFGSDPFFFDDGSAYLRDHGSSLLYGVSGDTGLHTAYHPTTPMVGITPELPSECYAFLIECHPDPDEKIEEVGTQQVRLIRRLVTEAGALVSSSEAEAYGPNHVGTYTSGLWTREYRKGGPVQADARPTFTKSVWQPLSPSPLIATIDGVEHEYQPGRTAAHYELFYLDKESGAFEPTCLPCRIDSGPDQTESSDGTLCDGECVKLCDENRLPAEGWELQQDGGDCFWVPTDVEGTLTFPHKSGWTSLDPDPSHCHFTFSMSWSGEDDESRTVVLEREAPGGGWQELWRVPYKRPINEDVDNYVDDRLISFAYEADSFLDDETPAFRFRLVQDPPSDFRVYDPVIYCRLGGLP